MEEVTKKKVSKVKRFLESLFLLLSILFLLALVYFELPWKFILFLTFLFYFKLLIPKKYQKKGDRSIDTGIF